MLDVFLWNEFEQSEVSSRKGTNKSEINSLEIENEKKHLQKFLERTLTSTLIPSNADTKAELKKLFSPMEDIKSSAGGESSQQNELAS